MENVNGCINDIKGIKDEKQSSEDENNGSDAGSSDSNDNNDSDEEMETPDPHCKPEQLFKALKDLVDIPRDFVVMFELQHSPLLVIAKTENDDRLTFPIYNRVIGDSNLLHLKSGDFEIINPSWDEYLVNFIIPKIKFEMVLDFAIKPILKSFWILQSPAPVTSLVQHQLDEKMFASLVIQLPSKFNGGAHQIEPICSHTYTYHHSRYFDLFAKTNGKCEFSPFCFVFHRDYKHEMKPITEGVGSYLVYDLGVSDDDVINLPKIPGIDDEMNELSLRSMLSNWRKPGKIVIGLSKDYAKEDLSLQNLQSVDLAMVMLLKKQYDFMFDYGRFELFLGYLTRTFHGEVIPEATRFNTKDASNILQTEYHIECLKHINGKEMVHFSYFHVKLDEQVWPVDLFEGVAPYRCTRERCPPTDPWDVEISLHVAKYYRRPVIVLFARYNIIDELKASYVDVAEIYQIFITLYREYERQPCKERSFRDPERFNIWARSISGMTLPKDTKHAKELTVSFLKILISLGDITCDTRAFEHYFESAKRVLTEDIIPLLINQCNKCNWLPYSQILCDLFKKIRRFSKAEKFLNYFIDDDGFVDVDAETPTNKPMVLQSVLKVILDERKGQHFDDFSKFFRSVWNLAKRCEFDIREFGKSQNILYIVPFLIELAEEDAKNKLDDSWLDIANHFLKITGRRNAHIANMLEKLRSVC